MQILCVHRNSGQLELVYMCMHIPVWLIEATYDISSTCCILTYLLPLNLVEVELIMVEWLEQALHISWSPPVAESLRIILHKPQYIINTIPAPLLKGAFSTNAPPTMATIPYLPGTFLVATSVRSYLSAPSREARYQVDSNSRSNYMAHAQGRVQRI